MRMPAPSPAMGSAPTAPRCSRFSRMASASLDQLVRFVALEVGDEADAARVVLAARIEEPARARMGQRGIRLPRAHGRLRSQTSWPLAFRLACIHDRGGPACARLGPPATRPEARRKQASCRAEPNAAAPWPSPASGPCSIPFNLPDRMRGCTAASGGCGTLRPITPNCE